jgi:indole-3-glycerol phosphate synthase
MISDPRPADLLETIVAATRRIIEVRAEREPLLVLEQRAADVSVRSGVFRNALVQPDRVNVIAECKRRSPSRGVLRADYDPAAIAREYEIAGAAAVSVLTEPTFFDGAPEHLTAVRAVTKLPVLRKDFIVDPYQIFEARAMGADAILLIVSALKSSELRRLHVIARDMGLDVLVEVHDAAELETALKVGATIVGVNNRNLRTLEVDTDTSQQMIERIPSGVVAVAESGLRSGDDVIGLRQAGYSAFLIGEHLISQPSPGAALGEILSSAQTAVSIAGGGRLPPSR